jgi:hypothetical protein
MGETTNIIEKRVKLSAARASQLSQIAQAQRLSEDQVIEKALDILFSLADSSGSDSERQGWSSLSEQSLQRVWDNENDASYDNWRDLYGVPAR